jgi:serine/threonine protein kinase
MMDKKSPVHNPQPEEIQLSLPDNVQEDTRLTSLPGRGEISTSSSDKVLARGDIIKQRFVLDKLLGEGGMGAVYRALDLRKYEAGDPQPYVAIKILSSSFKRHPRALVTLQREAKKTQQLAHPNIVTVYDFDRDGDLIYLTMEELTGQSLGDFLKQRDELVKLDFKKRCQLILQIAMALSYAHSKGFVHSDLKPANVFLTRDGNLKLLDFGIARAVNQEVYQDSFDAAELGGISLNYASPEMLNFQSPHPSDDIYALGIMACQIFGGIHPYAGQEATTALENKMRPRIPRLYNFLLRRLLYRTVDLERSKRTPDGKTFINQFYAAIKAPRRLLSASLLIFVLGMGNYFYVKTFHQQGIPFESLTPMEQQQFYQLVNEANVALSLGDLEGAAFAANKAFLIHQSHKDFLNLKRKITSIIEKNIGNAKTLNEKEFFKKQLSALKEYPAFADKK